MRAPFPYFGGFYRIVTRKYRIVRVFLALSCLLFTSEKPVFFMGEYRTVPAGAGFRNGLWDVLGRLGVYDTTLFKYPNWAQANRDGTHNIHVKAGLITGIAESQLGLITWGQVKGIRETDFTIKLLPHEITD
jgi:hypothetical protein